MRNIIFILSVLLLNAYNSYSQEFNCRVKINDQQVQISDKSIFRGLEQRLQEFINNTRWTNEPIATQERSDLNI